VHIRIVLSGKVDSQKKNHKLFGVSMSYLVCQWCFGVSMVFWGAYVHMCRVYLLRNRFYSARLQLQRSFATTMLASLSMVIFLQRSLLFHIVRSVPGIQKHCRRNNSRVQNEHEIDNWFVQRRKTHWEGIVAIRFGNLW
jgi:hypothetical protein